MNKSLKSISLLAVFSFATSCNIKGQAPALISLDLSEACIVFNSNNCTGVHDEELKKSGINTEGLKMGDFHLYKTDENGVTKRVHFKTKNSDDDPYYTSKSFFVELEEMSKDYFFIDLGRYSGKNEYFINKKTGEALKFSDDFRIDRPFETDEWPFSTSTLKNHPVDKNGNIYSLAYHYKSNSYVVARFSINEKEVTGEKIYEIPKTYSNRFSVDLDGNVICSTDNDTYFISVDGKVISPFSANETYRNRRFWTAYDGNIYSLDKGNVEKLTYNKEQETLEKTVVKSFIDLKDTILDGSKLLFLDELKQIYYYETGSNKELLLYPLYDGTTSNEVITINGNDLRLYNDYEDEYPKKYYLQCDDNSLYVSINQGPFILNRIDLKNNMAITQTTYEVDYNDGTRILSNQKLAIFYWNNSEINCPPNDSAGYMSVGIFDIKTGTLSKQDSFITGIAARSRIVNLK